MALDQGAIRNRDLARALGITPQAAHYHLRRLVEGGVLLARGKGRGAHYVLAATPPAAAEAPAHEVRLELPILGLEEHVVWRRLQDASPWLAALPRSAVDILHYAATELVNNAIDHSDAESVRVRLARRDGTTELDVEDHGVGAFARMRQMFGLESDLEAVAELSKGKRTTQPDRHSGEGLFFVSKVARTFELEAGSLRWMTDNVRDDVAIGQLAGERKGTLVRVRVPDAPRRTLSEVFEAFTIDHEFARTHIVVRLFEHGTSFISRSEAKRLLEGLDRFAEILLDFAGVDTIGQGFADEVFRVWQRAHPTARLVVENAVEPVDFMIRRGRG